MLSIENSVVSDNSAEVSGSSPGEDVRESFAGGLRIVGSESRTATIRDTLVRGNRAMTDVDRPETLSVAFGGGIYAGAPVLLERTMVTDNLVRSVGGDAAADGGGIELVETDMTIRDSLIARNSVVIEAERAAIAVGGGIANAGRLTVERTRVLRNRVRASGAGGLLPFGEPSSVLGGGHLERLVRRPAAGARADEQRHRGQPSRWACQLRDPRRRALDDHAGDAHEDHDRRQPAGPVLRMLRVRSASLTCLSR